MKQIWKKEEHKMDEVVRKYVFSPNLDADKRLLEFDILASNAHAKMLCSIGILTQNEYKNISASLLEIADLHAKSKFDLSGFEDIHSAIESYLTQKLGDAGKKIHTGRSRNDQILVAIRLFTISNLKEIKNHAKLLARAIYNFASAYEFMPMPGFTHMQHAMPSSIGQWAGSFLESILNDISAVSFAIKMNNQNPLGSAAGFGTAINLDRKITMQELCFEKNIVNSLFCQNSKGKFEMMTISCLMQVMMTLSKMANDMIIFYSQEFSFLTFHQSLTSGSSIMPQKRNLDVMEVLRAKSAKVFANLTQLNTAYHNLISGYNKDMKFAKDIIIDSIDITKNSLEVMTITVNQMGVCQEKLMDSFKDLTIFAADKANELVVKNGISFRDAYIHVSQNLHELSNIDILENIKAKKHIGATGNLMLDALICELEML